MSAFKQKVVQIVRLVPQGKVVSYGQVAAYAGMPRAAREVGWVLRETQEDLPWWRVVNNAGKISIDGNRNADKPLQAKLLIADGLEVSDEYMLDIESFRFRLDEATITALQLDDTYVQTTLAKYK